MSGTRHNGSFGGVSNTNGQHGTRQPVSGSRGLRNRPMSASKPPPSPTDTKSETASIASRTSSKSSSSVSIRPVHPIHMLGGGLSELNDEMKHNARQGGDDMTGFGSAVPPPLPHLPLRKKSSQLLRLRTSPSLSSPLNEEGHPRAEQTSPTYALPISLARRSSAPRLRGDAQHGSLRSLLSATAKSYGDGPCHANQTVTATKRRRGLTTSQVANVHAQSEWPQGPLRSISDHSPASSGSSNVAHATEKPGSGLSLRDSHQSFAQHDHTSLRDECSYGARGSYRSAFTAASSTVFDASGTERSSVLTPDTSLSDLAILSRHDDDLSDEGMSVDDAIGMYANGFEDDLVVAGNSRKVPGGDVVPQALPIMDSEKPSLVLPDVKRLQDIPEPVYGIQPPLKTALLRPLTHEIRSSTQIMAGRIQSLMPEPPLARSVPRDCYGFKRCSQYITLEEFDAWYKPYSDYRERRCKKWTHLMKKHGLDTENPTRFPPRSDKVKHYVRKGIPPEWRGAAWFWYAGGPDRLAQSGGVYWELIEQVNDGKLSDGDREHIERDLHRTFPDNIRFRPDPTPAQDKTDAVDGYSHPHHGTPDSETSILRALRRVLQAFAVHNPSIGYCQSLNFLAGLLLLFLDEDEEKAFVMLGIIANEHLPGTHGRVLGANVDIGVLMSCIKDSMPAIWAKIDDKDDGGGGGAHRHPSPHPRTATLSPSTTLPTVSLATTAWFMSCFVGTLPIETVLRVWDCFFYEGAKTLFRAALAIFKLGEPAIRAVADHMEIFQVVQTIPRRMLDANALMEACFRRRNGFAHLSQEVVEGRRAERRQALKSGGAGAGAGAAVEVEGELGVGGKREGALRRAASRTRFMRSQSRKRTARGQG